MRQSAEQTRSRPPAGARILGAFALLVIGAVHYQQYRYAFYSSIPTIGALFLVNFLAATSLGLLLLAPLRSWLGRAGGTLHDVAAVAGIGVAAGGLVALLVSEHTPLFGFMEHGYRFVIVLTIASDAAAIAALTLFLIRAHAGARRPDAAHPPPCRPPNRETRNQRPAAPAAER
jgi:hypothetical protein